MNISTNTRPTPRMRTIPQAVQQLKADGITEIGAYRLRIWCKEGVVPTVSCGRKLLLNYNQLLRFLGGEQA